MSALLQQHVEKLYRCTSMFSALKYCKGFFWKSQLCAQSFLPIFGLLAIFDRNFTKIVAPPSNKNANSLMHLKEQSL